MGGKTRTSGQGRPKGIPNKFTGQLKDMVRQALEEAGGVDYLHAQAKENPTAFLTLVGKLLPAEIKAEVSADIGITGKLVWEWPKT